MIVVNIREGKPWNITIMVNDLFNWLFIYVGTKYKSSYLAISKPPYASKRTIVRGEFMRDLRRSKNEF